MYAQAMQTPVHRRRWVNNQVHLNMLKGRASSDARPDDHNSTNANEQPSHLGRLLG